LYVLFRGLLVENGKTEALAA